MKICQPQFVVASVLPEKFRAEKMYRPSRQKEATVAINVRVHHVERQKCVIVLNGRAEELGNLVAHSEREAREVAGSPVVKALLAEADGFHIAQAIENRKSFTPLQHPGTIICERRSG